LSTLKYVSHGLEVTSTNSGSPDLLYETPANFTSRVTYLHISNGDAQKKISVNFFHAHDNEDHLIADDFKPDANTLHELIGGGSVFYMQSGDKIECFKESGGDFHITISVEEMYTPGQ